jgi:hypothetical protein
MRFSVNAEEIAKHLEIVHKTTGPGATLIGVRFYIESSDKMYPLKHPEDEASSVTFWVSSGRKGYRVGDEKTLVELLKSAAIMLKAEAETLKAGICGSGNSKGGNVKLRDAADGDPGSPNQ